MGRRNTPLYWWDFDRPGEFPIKVESDADWLPHPIATFDGSDAIERAASLVEDLNAGRVDPRRV